MGKKYIIELESGTHIFVLGPEGIVHIGEPDVVYETVDGMQIGDAVINAKPYTVPDLEQVRKEAYEQGRKDVETQFCSYDACKNRQEEYQRGLSDAWKAARKIANMTDNERFVVIGTFFICRAFCKNTAPEAIEKIRQYEQTKEEQITKGDIVLIKSTPEVEILVTYADEEYVSGIALTEVDGNCEIGDQYTNIRISNVEKTGKHYDIVSVLQKMREESNG